MCDNRLLHTCLMIVRHYTQTQQNKLETVSIAEPLKTGSICQIWHTTAGQWCMLTGLISSGLVYCVAHVGQRNRQNITFLPHFHILGAFVPNPSAKLAGNCRPFVYTYYYTTHIRLTAYMVYTYTPNFIFI